MKSSVRPNQLQHLLTTAKDQNYSNLYMNYENLEEIPREVLEISSIQGLYLKRNLLKSLPPDLWKLRSLKTLYLPSNKLTSLPEEIGRCENLENLNVDSNFLKSLPKKIGELTKLKKLQACNNELAVIPPEIGQLRSLEVLELMKNHIQYLPEELAKCKRLRSLFLGSNMIEELPTVVLELSCLEELFLSKNAISHLPHDLDKLCQLKSLVVDSNQDLIVVPASVFQIKDLRTLGTQGCGLRYVGQNSVEILADYLKSQSLTHMAVTVEPLLELCLRNAPPLETKLHELLPKPLQVLLKTPRGHCYICKQEYYVNAFFQLYNSFHAQDVAVITDKLYSEISNTNCYFIFCFCSFNCLLNQSSTTLTNSVHRFLNQRPKSLMNSM